MLKNFQYSMSEIQLSSLRQDKGFELNNQSVSNLLVGVTASKAGIVNTVKLNKRSQFTSGGGKSSVGATVLDIVAEENM